MVTVTANGLPGRGVILSADAPEIVIERGLGQALANGETEDMLLLPVGTSTERTFAVRNRGRADLTGLSLSVTGPNAGLFTVTEVPDSTVPGLRGSTIFTVRFRPDSPGLKTATLRIASNDADEGDFRLNLIGGGANSAPTITRIPDQEIDEDSATAALAFTVTDAETPDTLTVTVLSSNPGIAPPSSIVPGGSGASRTLTITPPAGAYGVGDITVKVSDGVNEAQTRFRLAVRPVNDPPTLAEIPEPAPARENAGVKTIPLTGVSSGEGAEQTVTLTVATDLPALFSTLEIVDGVLRCETAPDASGRATVTVTADDGQGAPNSTVSRSVVVTVLPTIHAAGAAVAEGAAGVTTPALFRVFLNTPQSGEVSVRYRTEVRPGQAAAGSDFTAAEGTAVFAAGTTETFVRVDIPGDGFFEGDETFSLVLSEPVGGFLAEGDRTVVEGVITNDDAQPGLSVGAGSVTESPGAGPFQVWISARLSAPSSVPLSWTVTTRAGTAAAGEDFTPLSPSALTFPPGESLKWVAVNVTGNVSGDTGSEEVFYTDFTAASGGPASVVTSDCTIRRLEIREFFPLPLGLHALRFPTGLGQSYVIEEAESPTGPWTNNSAILLGGGSVVTQVVFSGGERSFFRVVAAPASPGAAAVGP